MTLEVKREALSNALSLAQTCVETKGTIPVLAYAAFEQKNGRLTITATDCDVTIQTVIEAEGDDQSFLLPAQQLNRLAGLFDEELIRIKLTEKADRAVVTCGKSKYTLPSLARDAFPNVEEVQGRNFLINGDILKKILERTIFCVSTDESRYQLKGVLLKTAEGKLHAVATDHYRLALVRYAIPFSEEVAAIVPRRAIGAVIKALNDDDPVAVTLTEDKVKFEQGETIIRARTIIGQFPNYELVVPKERNHSVVIAAEANKVLKRSALTAEIISTSKAPSVIFAVSKQGVEVTSSHAEKGEGVEFIPSKCESLNGTTMSLKFASLYLTQMLALEPEVNLAFNDNSSQFLLTPNGLRDYEYKYVVMPCRI